MIRIAVIGDIGSGKSFVAKQFGCPVFNADVEVSKLYRKKYYYNKLKKQLPKYVFSFPIDKQEISLAITSNKNNLSKINKIIHPEIKRELKNFIIKNKNKKAITLDIPLLMENKINKKKDILVFIDAKKKDVYKRLKKRVNFNPKIINIFKRIQLPLKFKKNNANYIIKNNFKRNFVKQNVKNLMKKILNK